MPLREPATCSAFLRSFLQSALWNGLSSETPKDSHCSNFDFSFELHFFGSIPRTIALGSLVPNDL